MDRLEDIVVEAQKIREELVRQAARLQAFADLLGEEVARRIEEEDGGDDTAE